MDSATTARRLEGLGIDQNTGVVGLEIGAVAAAAAAEDGETQHGYVSVF